MQRARAALARLLAEAGAQARPPRRATTARPSGTPASAATARRAGALKTTAPKSPTARATPPRARSR
jgi:hypothetical protein